VAPGRGTASMSNALLSRARAPVFGGVPGVRQSVMMMIFQGWRVPPQNRGEMGLFGGQGEGMCEELDLQIM
jgi:hypothetical protein